jgi:hypothetical protein
MRARRDNGAHAQLGAVAEDHRIRTVQCLERLATRDNLSLYQCTAKKWSHLPANLRGQMERRRLVCGFGGVGILGYGALFEEGAEGLAQGWV